MVESRRRRSLSPPHERSLSRSFTPAQVRYRPRSGSRLRSPLQGRLRTRSRSPSLPRPRRRSRSRSRGRSSSRIRGREEAANPGNTLYVTGLSTRVTERDLEDHFCREGKVQSCFLVMDPHTRVPRGFGFVTMETLEDADRCIEYLNQSVLDGRCITVERSRRKRPRTPTPGHYRGLSSSRDDGRGDNERYHSVRDDYEYHRSPRRSSYRGGHGYSPRRSPYDGRSWRYRSPLP